MKASYCPLLFAALLLLWTACSKDKELTNDENIADTTALSFSNISKSPGVLLGSWNLTRDNSTQNPEKTEEECLASNVHFLENNTFYLKYQ